MNPGSFAGMGNPGLARAAAMGNRIEQMIAASSTWTAPVTGEYLIFAVGAGGSGAAQDVATSSGQGYQATGGGAGGLAVKRVFLQAGTQLGITIGAGGAGVAVNNNGNNGGDTTVNGGGVSLFAQGGRGGTRVAGGTGNNTTSGALGGIASGGDWNYQGGSSGDATTFANFAGGLCSAYSGGGAVAWHGVGYRGGNATASDNSHNSPSGITFRAYGGGAGIGGRGGDATVQTSQGGTNVSVGGGGSSAQAGNDAIQVGVPGTIVNGAAALGFAESANASVTNASGLTPATTSIFQLTGTGTAGSQNAVQPGPGAGYGGNNLNNVVSGIFGGGGGYQAAYTGTQAMGRGGGTGGNYTTSYAAGNGVVFIVWSYAA